MAAGRRSTRRVRAAPRRLAGLAAEVEASSAARKVTPAASAAGGAKRAPARTSAARTQRRRLTVSVNHTAAPR